MSLEITKKRFNNLLTTVGRATVGTLFPDDFELYITALELVDSDKNVVEYFIFPLNPISISETHPQITTVKKTAAGISSVSMNTFFPTMITLNGDFGRKFKILIGNELINFQAFSLSEQLKKTGNNFKNQIFSNTIKTGYGCIKILERIMKKSTQLDSKNQPFSLHLYNLSLGNSYLVKVIGQPTISLSIEKNMIPSYNITFQTLGLLNQINKDSLRSTARLVAFAIIQNTINSNLNKLKSTILN